MTNFFEQSTSRRMHGLVVSSTVLMTFALTNGAGAQEADAAFNAFNASFLVKTPSATYYAQTIQSFNLGNKPQALWGGALDILVAEDAYERTYSTDTRNLVVALLNGFKVTTGTDWSYDGWNDDVGWMIEPFVRGYQLTGDSSYLAIAEKNWNTGYNRGWDTTSDGGGIWENSDHFSKCALSNDNFAFEGVELAQFTGDGSYLTKAEGIYAWMRAKLANTTNARNGLGAPGQVNGCLTNTGGLQGSDNVYDAGTFLKVADELYRVTGNAAYKNDAIMVANHIVGEGPVMHNGQEACGCQWAYWFGVGLSELATDANLWPQYQAWLQGNANAAWSKRDNLGLTWNDWTAPTNDRNPQADSLEMSSAAAIWQVLPPADLGLKGNFEIINTASKLPLNVQGSSEAAGASIIQSPDQGSTNELWTFVPTSGGYYQIKSVSSGQVINVYGASAKAGALIIQWPAQGIIPGNDQWKPIQNNDGTYSCFNLNSHLALDDPNQSTSSGTEYQQYFGLGTAGQKFTLVQK